jgi:hypothetical protein
MAGTRAKALAKMQAALWVLEATAVMQQSADKGQTAHGSDLHLFRGHVARKCGDEAVKDKMSAVVKKALRSILACIPETALLTFCTGDTGLLPPGVLIDAAKLCWQHRCKHGGWPMAQGGAAILIRG